MKGAIFDLDGVLVDTAKYHYLAWKALADKLGIEFQEQDNERLKGVSRMQSLQILLSLGGRTATAEEQRRLAEWKNSRYVAMLQDLRKRDLLPGAENCIRQFKQAGIRVALGSASRNAPFILEKLGIRDLFDVVVDGNLITKAKPDPEVFLKAAALLELDPKDCCVFEDSQAGIQAARRAGCAVVAVDPQGILTGADQTVASLLDLTGGFIE